MIISTTYASMDEEQTLLLGPFHGKPACQMIKFGKGVCGTAAAKQETVVVADVEKFPGHIACDAESKSEIVVPIIINGQVCAYASFWRPGHLLIPLLIDRRHHRHRLHRALRLRRRR